MATINWNQHKKNKNWNQHNKSTKTEAKPHTHSITQQNSQRNMRMNATTKLATKHVNEQTVEWIKKTIATMLVQQICQANKQHIHHIHKMTMKPLIKHGSFKTKISKKTTNLSNQINKCKMKKHYPHISTMQNDQTSSTKTTKQTPAFNQRPAIPPPRK